MIFQHGLLLSQKFFADDSEVVIRYKHRVARRFVPKEKNFIKINIRSVQSLSTGRIVDRKMTPNPMSIRNRASMFLNINTPLKNGSPYESKQKLLYSELKDSLFDSQIKIGPLMPSAEGCSRKISIFDLLFNF